MDGWFWLMFYVSLVNCLMFKIVKQNNDGWIAMKSAAVDELGVGWNDHVLKRKTPRIHIQLF